MGHSMKQCSGTNTWDSMTFRANVTRSGFTCCVSNTGRCSLPSGGIRTCRIGTTSDD